MSSAGQNHLFIKRLFAKSFRNLNEIDLSFDEGKNLFIGLNGQGKTNCLEAISLACSLRPLQSLQNADLIQFDEPQARIMASFSGHLKLELEVDIFAGGKKAKLNGHALKNAAQLSQVTSVVSFIPAELNLVTGSSSLRRRALDQAAGSLFIEHALAIKSYEKVLAHRNKLLKSWPLDHEALAVFSQMLVKEGAAVRFYRLKAMAELNRFFRGRVEEILGAGQEGCMSYLVDDEVMSASALSDLAAGLNEHRLSLFAEESRRKVTLFGPHLDDLAFAIGAIDARRFASRAQSRALVLSLKLAQMAAIEQIRGLSPIIILDDIVSEFDFMKKINLIDMIDRFSAQAFFSTTDHKTFGGSVSPHQVFSVEHGAVAQDF